MLNALEYDGIVRIIETDEEGPAFFDTKKCGYMSAVYNGFLLRKKIHESLHKRADRLVFDMLGIRQRFLAWPYHCEAVCLGNGNIYLDYAHYLNLIEGFTNGIRNNSIKLGERVYVFPDSRIKAKELPDGLINGIAEENIKCGKKTTLVKIGKPTNLLKHDSLHLQWVDGFDQLIEQVRKADMIVSADSLPAHLAEYFGIPVFVFTPVPNDYWMPISSFKGGYFSGFNSLVRYKAWINQI